MTDAELLAADDADSFAEFYRRHSRRVAGYLMRATGDVEIAADLTAETFAAALVARERYRSERAAPAAWLFGIAAHKLNDWRRRGYAEDRARRSLRMERLELSADDAREIEQRAAVHARLVHERGYGDIAGSRGVSEAVVRQRVSRGLASLRRRMGGER